MIGRRNGSLRFGKKSVGSKSAKCGRESHDTQFLAELAFFRVTSYSTSNMTPRAYIKSTSAAWCKMAAGLLMEFIYGASELDTRRSNAE